MILFHTIVQVFALSDFDALVFIAVVLLDSGRVGATFVDVDKTGLALKPYGFIQETPRSILIALSRQ